jgi:hypothetical protein
MAMNNQKAKDAAIEVPTSTTGASRKGRTHKIDIAGLIIHKYPEPAALLKKADKISREIIHSELREGELLRVDRPGQYTLILPKLLPEAGALRTSVIAEQLARAIADLNPAKKSIADKDAAADRGRDRHSAKAPETPAKVGPKPLPPKPSVQTRLVNPNAVPSDDERRRAATQAIELMSSHATTKAEELFALPAGRGLVADTTPRYQPVWNAKKAVISAYRISLMEKGSDVSAAKLTTAYGLESLDAANALIDAAKYRAACEAIAQLAAAGEQALIIVPVSFSTVDHSRYIGAFLDAGILPSHYGLNSRDRVVFEIVNFPSSVSRYRLREAAAYLRGRCRGMNLCFGGDWAAASFSEYRELGISAVGLDASAIYLPEQRLMKSIDEFTARCDVAGLIAYARDVNRFSTLASAIAAGMTYLSGPAFAPYLSSPHGVTSLDISRLVSMSARRWTGSAGLQDYAKSNTGA